VSVLPSPVPAPTPLGLRWGDLVLDGIDGPYPVPHPPEYPPPVEVTP